MHMAVPSIKTLIDKIRIVRDENELQAIFEAIKPGIPDRSVRIAFVNAHAINLCHNDHAFLEHLLECDYVFRDGAGMKILYRLLKRDPGLNLNGTDLIPRIMKLYKGQDIMLFGTDSPYLDRAAERVSAMGLKPVLTINGFHEARYYLEAIRGRAAPLMILAMGMPKQEHVARLIAREAAKPGLIICGGAILDFLGEKVTRAPEIFQKTGMEWFYRLIQEPKRLFGRYVIGNFTFMARALQMAFTPDITERDSKYMPGTRPLKVLHVVRQFAPAIGGLESYVRNMAQYQQKTLGYDCSVLTLNKVFHGGEGELPAEETIDDIKIRRVGFFGRRRFFIPKVSPFYFTKFDIVHVHNTDVFYDYVALVGFLTRTPCVATTHGGFFHTNDFSLVKKLYFNLITRLSSRAYKSIFAISRNDYDMFQHLNRNVVLQPNAVEPLGQAISEGKDFLYIGRLAQNKNIGQMLEVFALLKQKHDIASNLHIIGPAWDVSIADMRMLANRHGIGENVQFHGAIAHRDMESIASRCGYFLSASSFEGFGMSMLEAMTIGLIPFVHDNESFKDLVAQSGVGLAINFREVEQAARAIAEHLPQVSVVQRQQAQNFARGFSWNDLVANTGKAYMRILS